MAVDFSNFDKTTYFIVDQLCFSSACSCIHLVANCQTQLKPCRLFCLLFSCYPLDIDWEYLLHGFIFGFRVINPNCATSYSSRKTLYMDLDKKLFISSKLTEEIKLGYISRATSIPQCVHNMFCVTKDASYRVVVDCSKPLKTCVNNYVDSVSSTFSYTGIDSLVENMHTGDYIAVTDIKNAYRSVTIHETCRTMQGLVWDLGNGPEYFYDNRMSMGLSSSPYIFTRIGNFVSRCAIFKGVQYVANYLDDFALLGHDISTCYNNLLILNGILRHLGFFISYKKLRSPSRCTVFLGIEIDTMQLSLRLPLVKFLN